MRFLIMGVAGLFLVACTETKDCPDCPDCDEASGKTMTNTIITDDLDTAITYIITDDLDTAIARPIAQTRKTVLTVERVLENGKWRTVVTEVKR